MIGLKVTFHRKAVGSYDAEDYECVVMSHPLVKNDEVIVVVQKADGSFSETSIRYLKRSKYQEGRHRDCELQEIGGIE